MFGVSFSEVKKMGISGIMVLFFGVFYFFVIGVIIVFCFGYRDFVVLIIIGGGVVIYIVGLVSGIVIGVFFDIIVLSIVVGLIKFILVMILILIFVKKIKLNNFCIVMIYGGVMGMMSGVVVGLVVIDVKFVFYGVMIVIFYIGFGCLFVLFIFFLFIEIIF